MSSIDQLLEVMRKLRNPDSGCAWDVAQTFKTIAPYTVEEAYEVADAIERDDLNDLKDELGDLLLQVVFHAQMADEQKAFNFDEVVKGIVNKMIRRHPHVFGDANNTDPDALKTAWETQKAEERAAKSNTVVSAMDDIALALPALLRADKIQKRAARIGFDWPESEPIWGKLTEEADEVREAVAAQNKLAIEDELGDLLFTVVNLARHHNVDPEVALHKANKKFETRFRIVEQLANNEQQSMETMDLEALDALWNKAKRQLHSEEA